MFEDALESNNALSWLAPPAVQTRMINNILSDENKQELISQNEAALREQAKVFYSGIVATVDPEITIAVNLGVGQSSARIWTCDLTHDYVTINGDYRT